MNGPFAEEIPFQFAVVACRRPLLVQRIRPVVGTPSRGGVGSELLELEPVVVGRKSANLTRIGGVARGRRFRFDV